MRVDVLTIFPDYLAPLGLSLLGRAQADGLLTVRTHDLRDWTHDRHRTVDDTPYGGGAGMVMRPEPWGEAIDAVLLAGVGAGRGDELGDELGDGLVPTLVIPTPAGVRLDQRLAEDLAARPWLIVACGRYEGIDQRVTDHFAERVDVLEISLGDYVLNGGEAAALVIIEAAARLLPDVVGNPASLDEESHGTGADAGLLEYPVYTKPPSWRGLDVPEVLLSGHHDRIDTWRRDESVRRTAQRRPDLAHPSQKLRVANLATEADVRLAWPSDTGEILTLQRCCWVAEAQANEGVPIPALLETLEDVRRSLDEWTTVVLRVEGRLVGSVRGRLASDSVWDIGRLMVAPDLEGRGLGRWLLAHVEQLAPPEATSYRLSTGAGSERNHRMYEKAGYRRSPEEPPHHGVIVLSKRGRAGHFGTGDFG
jgi:tRNA (guanine37-N1)-methyltransferase